MQFKNGNLVLSDAEIKLFSNVTMKNIDPQYPAAYFIGSLAEIKFDAEEYLSQIQSKQIHDERDHLKTKIIHLLIETCDLLTEKGSEAVEAAGASIKWQ